MLFEDEEHGTGRSDDAIVPRDVTAHPLPGGRGYLPRRLRPFSGVVSGAVSFW